MAKKIKIEALLPLLKFGLPQSEGQTVSLEKKQADEIIEAGYAKLWKKEVSEGLGNLEEEVDSEEEEETELEDLGSTEEEAKA